MRGKLEEKMIKTKWPPNTDEAQKIKEITETT